MRLPFTMIPIMCYIIVITVLVHSKLTTITLSLNTLGNGTRVVILDISSDIVFLVSVQTNFAMPSRRL